MILREIKIRWLGREEAFTQKLNGGLNLIKSRYSDEIIDALRAVTNNKVPLTHGTRHLREFCAEATVRLSQKDYYVTALNDAHTKAPLIRARDADGNDATGEYLRLTSHCEEEDASYQFTGDANNEIFRVLQYYDEDRYYRPSEFSRLTGGFSEIKAFRAYLRSYLKSFKGELIREGKKYELVLSGQGGYDVRYTDECMLPVALSESEQVLFRYLCFLNTAEFWHGFESLRDLHCIKKPLLIGNFLERLDESIDLGGIIKRSTALDRQVIIVTGINEKREINDFSE